MQYHTYSKNDYIIQYGQKDCRNYYVLAKGSVKVTVYKQGSDPFDDKLESSRTMIKYMCEGQGFGELGILNNVPRSASVVAVDTNCEVYSLDAKIFKKIINGTNYEKKIKLANLLNQIPLLNSIDNFYKMNLADSVKTLMF